MKEKMDRHQLYFPSNDLEELFIAIQTGHVFADSKLFVDCVPCKDPKEILAEYRSTRNNPNFDLKQFVKDHFFIPERQSICNSDEFVDIDEHLNALWDDLTREDKEDNGTLISLPYPYVVPGGRFNELYYWDSYFTMLGLKVSNRIGLMEHMIKNFAYLLETFGFIPNGTRTYYLTRSQPPYFALMLDLWAAEKGEGEYATYRKHLKLEYDFWMRGKDELDENNIAAQRVVRVEENTILNRYWDNQDTPRPESYREDVEIAKCADRPDHEVYRNIRAACESGWDFSSRWLADNVSLQTIHTTELLPVDLNCLLYHLEKTLAKAAAQDKDKKEEEHYNTLAANRKEAIKRIFFSKKTHKFCDYDWKQCTQINKLTAAGLFPLWFKIADQNQADAMAESIRDHLLFVGGMTTTPTFSKQQWDAPNGWPPLNYIAYVALNNYGKDQLAAILKKHWIGTVERQYNVTGKMLEKYNVIYPQIKGGGGEYPSQDGFGWANGVYLHLKNTP